MTAAAVASGGPHRWRQRLSRAAPYILLAPGILWLLYFFIWPTIQMFLMSISSGSLDSGFRVTGSTQAYADAIGKFQVQFGNSLVYGGTATILDFLIGFPVAYTVAFRGGRYKNLLLFLVIAPFFTSFLIRTISWKILLGEDNTGAASLPPLPGRGIWQFDTEARFQSIWLDKPAAEAALAPLVAQSAGTERVTPCLPGR